MDTQLDYEITITPCDNYLYVYTEGLGSFEGANDLWRQIAQACEKYQCYNILGEQNLHSTVSTLDALNYPAMFKKVGITKKHRIAWVDRNPRTRETTEFIRDVLTNRLVGKGRLFNDVDSAKSWLLENN
jgi:hypothetical protein